MRSSVGVVSRFGSWLPLTLAAVSCSLGQSGIDPPHDEIFLPSGLAMDPAGDWLYIVNSNNDLRFNAGTLLPLDLGKAKSHRERTDWPDCTTSYFEGDHDPAAMAEDLARPCCVDLVSPHILNCNGRAYAEADATVELGSFAGATAVQPLDSDGTFRIFVLVRADPSVTFVDVKRPRGADGAAGAPQLRCTGPRDSTDRPTGHPFCDDHWKIRRPGGAEDLDNVLPEEPHNLTLDQERGILYVGHLAVTVRKTIQGGGISVIDAHALKDPRAANAVSSVAHVVFPASSSQGVTSMTLSDLGAATELGTTGDPLDSNKVLYAVSRSGPDITGMVLLCQSEPGGCDPENPARDLTLIPGEQIKSSVFLPSGTDIRGFLLSPFRDPYRLYNPSEPDRPTQAYVLHRNTPEASASANPAALVVLDRKNGPNGKPTNQASAVLEICNGPTQMEFHDAGRGKLLFITCYEGGQIYVVDVRTLYVVAIIEAGHGPTSLTFSPIDKTVAFVADYADNNVAVIDLKPGSPTEYKVVQRLGFPHARTE